MHMGGTTIRFWRVTDLVVMGVNNLGVALVIGPERLPRAGLALAAIEGTVEEAIFVCILEMFVYELNNKTKDVLYI